MSGAGNFVYPMSLLSKFRHVRFVAHRSVLYLSQISVVNSC